MILHGVRIAGSWSFWYEAYFKCGGFNSRDRICVKTSTASSTSTSGRSIRPSAKLAEEIQRAILENYYLVPVFRHAFVNAIGPRRAGEGRLPDDHDGLRLSVGRPEGEGPGRIGMPQFIVRRVLYSVVTLFILSATIFLIVRLTGDPVALMAGRAAPRTSTGPPQWGLDRSWPVQYVTFMQNAFRGELASPSTTGSRQRALLPAAAQLAHARPRRHAHLAAHRRAAGIISAVKVNTWWDNARQGRRCSGSRSPASGWGSC